MPQLTDRQREAIECRGKQLIVSAAAGAGKTTVLVGRIIDLICGESEVDVDRLLVVTYTNAAAAEMRGRIARALDERLAQSPRDRRLRRQLALLQNASIQTVHSFCGRLIRENFTLARVAPDFKLADEAQVLQMKQQAVDEMLERQYAENTPAFEALRRNICEERGDFRLQNAILDIYEKLRSHPEPQKWLEYVASRGSAAPESTEWGRETLRDARQVVRYARERIELAQRELETEPALHEKYAAAFEQCIRFARSLASSLDCGWDEAVALLNAFQKPSLAAKPRGFDAAFADKMKAARDSFCARMEGLKKAGLSRTSEEIEREQQRSALHVAELCRLVSEFSAHYTRIKEEKNTLDFSDLEHIALGLLRGENGEKTPLARELGERYYEVLVDEYQDTNEIQERIFQSVIREGGSAFFVGDVKQSIYRFRLADPAIFVDRLDSSEALPTENTRAKLALSDNFRSLPGVIDLCNRVFSALMTRRFGDVDYDDGHRLIAGRTEPQGGGEVWIVDTEGIASGEDEDERATAVEARLAAARIADILRFERVYGGDGTSRAARPSDCAILLSSYAGKAPQFARELRRAGIPALSVEQGGYFEAVEMTVMLSLLRIIENPRQDIPLISVLRSPVFLWSSDDLAEARLSAPDADFYTAVKRRARAGGEKAARFLRVLSELREASRDLPVGALVRLVYRNTDALGIFSALEGGAARAANLTALYQMALAFESEGARGLGAFLRYADAKIEAGKAPAPPVAGEGVHILSIHKSKGLEYPFVVLPDLNKRFNTDDSKGCVLFHQHLGLGITLRDPAPRTEIKTAAHTAVAARIRREGCHEELRKLYVAMTRAKQKLVMIMSQRRAAEKLEQWADEARGKVDAEFLAEKLSAMPWICAALALGGADAAGLANIIAWHEVKPAQYGAHEQSGAEAEDEWDYSEMLRLARREYPHLAAGRLPSKLTPTGVKLIVQDAAELEGQEGDARVRMYRRPVFGPGMTLSAAERGTAIHAFLRYVNLENCGEIDGARSEILRVTMLGHLSPEQAQSVDAAQVRALARSELARRIRDAQERLHEYEFSALFTPDELLGNGITDERILLNGAIDLLLFTREGIEVVDFKSDSIAPGFEARQAERHRLQLALYAAAAERIFGRKVVRSTVWFTATGAQAAL